MPNKPNDRLALFLRLQALEKESNADEQDSILQWLANGGDLPVRGPATPPDNSANDATEDLRADIMLYSDQEPHVELYVGDSDDGGAEGSDEDDEEDLHGDVEDEIRDEPDVEDTEMTDLDGLQNDLESSSNEPEDDVEKKECPICSEMRLSSEYAPSSNTNGCEHLVGICMPCMNEMIRYEVRRGNTKKILCPVCPKNLSREDIKTYASRDILARFEYLLFRTSIPDNYTMCLGPNCDGAQHHEDASPMMVCNTCQYKTCVTHKLPWHEGKTCEEFDADDSQVDRLEQDEATAKLLAESSRVCPLCGEGVFKEVGCDHLHCRCGGAWCYVCMVDWENVMRHGRTAHARTCSYHPDKVRVRKDQIEAKKNKMTELVHGGAVNETTQRAREARNETRRATIRPLAAEAAERRMQMNHPGPASAPKKKKVKLVAAWQE